MDDDFIQSMQGQFGAMESTFGPEMWDSLKKTQEARVEEEMARVLAWREKAGIYSAVTVLLNIFGAIVLLTAIPLNVMLWLSIFS